MNYREIAEEYMHLKKIAEKIVEVYFNVSGYKVANVTFNDDNTINIDYYDVMSPRTITVPEKWLYLNQDELEAAYEEFKIIKHQAYVEESKRINAQNKINIANSEREAYEAMKKKFGDS